MSHTPGPWSMRRGGIIHAESRAERKAIGQFTGIASEQTHIDEHPYNCTLIEAAPELLATLKEALLLFQADHALDRFDWGRAALRAHDIRELNELPLKIAAAIEKAERGL